MFHLFFLIAIFGEIVLILYDKISLINYRSLIEARL